MIQSGSSLCVLRNFSLFSRLVYTNPTLTAVCTHKAHAHTNHGGKADEEKCIVKSKLISIGFVRVLHLSLETAARPSPGTHRQPCAHVLGYRRRKWKFPNCLRNGKIQFWHRWVSDVLTMRTKWKHSRVQNYSINGYYAVLNSCN